MLIYRASSVIGQGIAKILYGWRAEGALEEIPDGPFILAANHIGMIDPWLVGCITHRPIRFMAKQELFRPRILRWWLHAVGSFPVRRGEADREAIRTALRILADGGIVGMFVEGTRNPDGGLLPVQHGAAMIAIRAGVPILPVAMVRQGRRRLTQVGRPIYPPADADTPRRELYAALSDQLGEAISRLQRASSTSVGGPVAQRPLSE